MKENADGNFAGKMVSFCYHTTTPFTKLIISDMNITLKICNVNFKKRLPQEVRVFSEEDLQEFWVNHVGTTFTPFEFNGRDGVMTDSNGLYYMRARYYNPDIRRFVNRDVVQGSIDNGSSLNKFAYVNGSPVSYVDPFGLCGDGDEKGFFGKLWDKWQQWQ